MADPHDWLNPLVTAVQDHALQTGRFESVNRHEPDPVVRSGVTAAIWPQTGQAARVSGLASTAVLQVLWVRLYAPALQEPRDDIDPALLAALSQLLAAYHGDLKLGGLVRSVDVLGMAGRPLSWQSGWLLDGRQRMVTITLPLIIDRKWIQGGSS